MKRIIQNKNKEKFKQQVNNKKIEQKIQKKQIHFNLLGIGNKSIQYQLTDRPSNLLKKLQYQNQNQYQILILNEIKGKYIPLDSQKPLSQFLQLYIDYKAVIKRIFLVSFEDKHKAYAQQTDLQKIKKDLGKKTSKYCFYNQEKKQVKEEELKENIQMIQVQKCNIIFAQKTLKNIDIPTKIPLKKAIQYIDISSIVPQQLSQLFIAEMKIQNQWIRLHDLQESTLQQISQGKQFQYVKISFSINLLIQLITNISNRQQKFHVKADQLVEDLKKKFQAVCKLQYKLQQWSLEQQQLLNHDTFITRKLFANTLRINVQELKNLQYYGFSKYQLIQSSLFINYNIQDDENFKDCIQKSQFPNEKYQYTFRVLCLQIIFSAIKKHSKIQTALKHIKKLIRQTNLPNISDNQAKTKLWQSNSKNKISFFNQFYVLHNITLSGQTDLKIELMRIYKNHSPLFLITYNQDGKKQNFFDENFWINTKSFVVSSIEIGDKVQGKSQLLNKIFNLNIQLKDTRHPMCSKSVMINYNIYRNQDCLVDLIDISSDSISQEQKKVICLHSNMIVIHYYSKDTQQVQKWIEQNCKDIPIILFERDISSTHVLDSIQQFKKQMDRNNQSLLRKEYRFPEKKYIHHYEHNIEQISDQIHEYLQKMNKKQQNNGWLFSKFLAQGNQKKMQIINILIHIQNNFTQIVPIKLLKQTPNPDQLGNLLSQDMKKILTLIQNEKEIAMKFMSKLRESIRIIRSRRIKQFSPINILQKMVQIKDTEHVKKDQKSIKNNIQILKSINKNKKTQQFNQILQNMLLIVQYNTQNIQKLQNYTKQLNRIFIEQIKPRQFSIENFWRCLTKLFHNIEHIPKQLTKYVNIVKFLFQKDFKSGKTFQVINGDSLQIPIYLLKSIQHKIENKKIMVVGIFGPQSSGKSTLLNYIFGCDFASSDGRCTNGIYGTYYQITNRCLPFNGILVLDTEGLFSNYKRSIQKGQNFDNKLVLFLLKICDILIMNTRGDIDQNCQNILQLSFDSVLMEHKQGAIYPNFYIVLNQSIGKMNDQQQNQVRQLRQKIISVNSQMQKYISTNKTNSMPIAFNTLNKNVNSQVLKRLQLATKTPTDDFYKQTKLLSLRFIEILKQRARNKNSQTKVITDVYDNMNAIWSSIINSPMLTMHASKLIKKFNEDIEKQSFIAIKQCQNYINEWSQQIPSNYYQIQDWQKQKSKKFQNYLDQLTKNLKIKFPHGPDFEKNRIINNCISKIALSMKSYYQSFKMRVMSLKIQLEFNQNKKRGVQGLMTVAKKLRERAYKQKAQFSDQYKDQQFNKAWSEHVKVLNDTINLNKVSEEKYKEVRQYYKNQLNLQKSSKIYLSQKSQFSINTSETFEQYSKGLMKQFLECQKTNFYNYFEELNIQPIISIKKNSLNSLSKQYLKMDEFFTFQPTTINYYLDTYYYKIFLNSNQLQNEIIYNIMNCEFLKNYYLALQQDLNVFKVKIANQFEFKRFLAKRFFQQFQKIKLNIKDIQQKKQYLAPTYFNYRKHQTSSKQLFKQYANSHYLKKMKILYQKLIVKAVESQNKLTKLGWSQHKVIETILQQSINYIVNNQYNNNDIQKIIQYIIYELQLKIINNFANIGLFIDKQKQRLIQYQIDQWFQSQNSYLNFNDQIIYKKMKFKLNLNYLKQNPIKYLFSSQLYQRIKNLPTILNSNDIQSYISQDKKDKHSYKIGYIQTQKTKVIEKYKDTPLLKDYINKDYENLIKGVKTSKFKSFIFDHIKKQLILQKIIKKVKQQHDMKSLQDLVISSLTFIKKQISNFNSDLKQISHQLAYSFISKIHQFSFCLISKKLEEKQKIKIQEKDTKMKEQKSKQKQLFMDLLNKDTESRCKRYAKVFMDSYQEFIINQIEKKKKDQLEKRKLLFLNKFKRRQFQKIIDRQMQDCNNPQIAYKYLMNPKVYLTEQYNKQIEIEIKNFLQKLNQQQYIQSINEIKNKINSLNLDLKGNQYAWDSDMLFQNLKQQDNTSSLLKKVFLQLLKQKNPISNKYGSNKFKLKSTTYFDNKIYFENVLNEKFLNKFFNPESLQIQNYAFFIKYICDQIENKIKNLKKKSQYTNKQKEQFRVGVEIKFCLFDCPFCGRLCDVDIKQSHQHQKHECSSGHQMRAIKSIRLEKKQKDKILSYASIVRCQDIQDTTLLDYNGTQKTWAQHKKSFENWSFDSQCQRTQKLMFQRLWKLAGQKICKFKQQTDKLQMIFIDFNQYDQIIKEQSNHQNHFIFSIDGSGSMQRNNKWNTQIQQLSQILSDLSSNINNKVSINIFTDEPTIVVKKTYADKVNPKSFAFPGGATVYEAVAAFKGAIKIIQQTGVDIDTHFVYISDGHGQYPDKQITQMLQLKQKINQKGYRYTYTSILIGGDSRAGMDKIHQRMLGSNQWVDNAGKIANTFKEVYKDNKMKHLI